MSKINDVTQKDAFEASDNVPIGAQGSNSAFRVTGEQIKDFVMTFVQTLFSTHTTNTSNPHSVTKTQVGLGNCDNTADADKPVSTATQTALDKKVDKVSGSSLVPDTKVTSYDSHLTNTSNPHSVTKIQVGLGNVDNTSDLNKPVSTAQQTALDKKVDKSDFSALGLSVVDGAINVTYNV